MFRCDNCGIQSKAGEKANAVYETRDKTYTEVRYEHDPKTRRNKKIFYETQGYEIETELKYCNHCYGELNGDEQRIDRTSQAS